VVQKLLKAKLKGEVKEMGEKTIQVDNKPVEVSKDAAIATPLINVMKQIIFAV